MAVKTAHRPGEFRGAATRSSPERLVQMLDAASRKVHGAPDAAAADGGTASRAQDLFPDDENHSHLFPPAVSRGGLSAVAAPAKRLPVRLDPEEIGITLVGNNVVHDRCSRMTAHSLTLGTKRMNCEIAFPCDAPLGVITSARSRSTFSIDLFAFLYAMFLAAWVSGTHQHWAARKSARMHRRERAHAVFLFSRASEIRQRRGQVSFRTLTMDCPFSIT